MKKTFLFLALAAPMFAFAQSGKVLEVTLAAGDVANPWDCKIQAMLDAALDPATEYTLECDIKFEGETASPIFQILTDNGGQWSSNAEENKQYQTDHGPMVATNEWSHQSVPFTIKDGMRSGYEVGDLDQKIIVIQFGSNVGTTLIDNIKISAGSTEVFSHDFESGLDPFIFPGGGDKATKKEVVELPVPPAREASLSGAFSKDGIVVTSTGMYQAGEWLRFTPEGQDLSKDEYIWLEYKEAEGTNVFRLKYMEYGGPASWNTEVASYKEDEILIPEGDGIVGIKIDNTSVMENGYVETVTTEKGLYVGDVYGQHCLEAYVQSVQGPSSIKPGKVFVGSAAQFKAASTVSAVKFIKANIIKDGKERNLFGQEVDENYRGVVIKDGKKYIKK